MVVAVQARMPLVGNTFSSPSTAFSIEDLPAPAGSAALASFAAAHAGVPQRVGGTHTATNNAESQ